MHQGKHQEYEKRLHELLVAATYMSGSNTGITSVANTSISNASCRNTDNKVSSAATTVTLTGNNTTINLSSPITVSGQQKEAWPCLSLSPVCQKDSISNISNKRIKERYKPDKNKSEKIAKSKSKNAGCQSSVPGSFKDIDANIEIDKSFFSDFPADKSRIDKNSDTTTHFTTKQKEKLISTINKVEDDPSEISSNCDDKKLSSSLNVDIICDNTENHVAETELHLTEISSNTYKSGTVKDQASAIDHQIDECEILRECDTKSSRENLKTTFKINRGNGVDLQNTAINSDILTGKLL